MNRPVTIVMYHYVRDLKRSRFPAISVVSAGHDGFGLDLVLGPDERG
jgi:hypothetical protein